MCVEGGGGAMSHGEGYESGGLRECVWRTGGGGEGEGWEASKANNISCASVRVCCVLCVCMSDPREEQAGP